MFDEPLATPRWKNCGGQITVSSPYTLKWPKRHSRTILRDLGRRSKASGVERTAVIPAAAVPPRARIATARVAVVVIFDNFTGLAAKSAAEAAKPTSAAAKQVRDAIEKKGPAGDARRRSPGAT
jgi:hypothetical protein